MKSIKIILTGFLIVFLSLIAIPKLCFAEKLSSETDLDSKTFAEKSFDSIKLNGHFDTSVQVTHQPHSEKVIIDNNAASFLKIEVSHKTLSISMKENIGFHAFEKIKIMISLEDLKSIKMNGSGKCYAEGINTDDFSAVINGSGEIVLAGKAKNLDFGIHGSGDIMAKNLVAEKAALAIYGSGRIITQSRQKLGIKIYGSGSVEYYANPEIEQSIYGSGKITHQK